MPNGFEIHDVYPLYAESPNLGETDESVVGIAGLDVTCLDCRERWTAGGSRKLAPGTFASYIGAIELQCASCGQTAVLNARILLRDKRAEVVAEG